MRWQLKNERGKICLPHWDLNNGPLEPKASELPLSCPDPFVLDYCSETRFKFIPFIVQMFHLILDQFNSR